MITCKSALISLQKLCFAAQMEFVQQNHGICKLLDKGDMIMPKMKTHRGAAKRFKKTSGGKIKRFHAYGAHILEKKSPKRKRKLRGSALVSKSDLKRVKILLPY